ncbi:hypothetical protein [Streptomyces sp. ITFR-6]|nr:hypothetical protein [Streptomyces sp. ITFR-6]WNI31485.1 hypothetical protein RLT59_23850 [Streptomyces sp. ITFR-6]
MSAETTPVDQDANATAAELLARAQVDREEQVATERARGQK